MAGPSSSRNANVLHGIVLRAKPRPVGFNSAVRRSLSTLDITKSPLCPSATTRSPCLGMRFFRLAMPTFSHGPDPIYYPLWISDFTAVEVWDLTASSALNLPTISARLRLVINYVAGVSSLALAGKTALLRTAYSGFCPKVRKKGAQISSQQDDWAQIN